MSTITKRKKTKSVSEDYFDWLCDAVEGKRKGLTILCRELHLKEFRWSVPNDDNRLDDGLRLRDFFMEENSLDDTHIEVIYFLKARCSVLEMLVALAKRIDFLMYESGSGGRKRTSKWFLEMLKNLGLDKFTDNLGSRDGHFGPFQEAEIEEKLEKFLDRAYSYNGSGGLFPLKKMPRIDQTRVEIWYQLMDYLDENYGN